MKIEKIEIRMGMWINGMHFYSNGNEFHYRWENGVKCKVDGPAAENRMSERYWGYGDEYRSKLGLPLHMQGQEFHKLFKFSI